MHTKHIGKKGKLAALLGAFAVVLSGAISPLVAQAVPNDPTNVETWGELEAALASNASTITITKDIIAEGGRTLNVIRPVTIQGDKTIYRDAKAQSYEPMFTVSGNGNLTLAGNIKLSGKSATCSGAATPVKHTNWEKHPSDEKYWNQETGTSPVEGKRVMLGFAESNRADTSPVPGIAYIGDDNIVRIADESNVVEGGKLKAGIAENKYVFTVTDVDRDQYGAAWFNTADGKVLGRSNELIGDLAPVIVVDKENPGLNEGAYKIENESNFKFKMGGLDTTVQKYIIPNNKQAAGEADKQSYAVAGARPQVNLGYGWNKTWLWVEDVYWTVEGATEADGSPTKFLTEKAAQDWANQHATTTPGACTIDSTCSKITTAMFNGSSGNEKGFFVQVNGGTFNLQGNAELSNFLTGPNVSYVAPVVAKGGTVNIKGGKIHDNSAGYNADDSKNQQGAKQIQTYIEKNLKRTETAGAVMYLGGAKGSITGGTIENNRGDTGAIVIDGENTSVTMDGGVINKNVGIHYGGAAYVHFGGSLVMAGNATMSNNYAWDRGGAVYVSSQDYASSIVWPVIDPKEYKPAIFVMDGNATMSGNYAVNRAGAVFVESHDVMLKSGQITGNFSRSLGGAIYVVGDGDARMYQLYVPNACITGNTAVKSGVNAGPLNKALPNATGDTCTVNNNLQSTGLLQGDTVDFKNHEGFGGGVWLCAFGGNATFGSGQDAQGNTADVVVAGNSAQPKQGADMHLRPTKPGAGSAINVLNNYSDNHWVNEKDNTPIVVNQVYTGPLNVKNTGSAQCSGSLKIQGNYARVGGGIASDGTVIFGPAKDIYRVHGKLDVTKTWENVPEKDRKAIDLQLAVKDGDTTYPLEGYKVRLDGTADVYDNENPLSENDGKYNDETPAWEATAWTGTFGLPLVYTDSSGASKPVFTFKDPDNASRTLDPAEPEDLPRLYELVKAKRLGSGNLSASLTIIETIDGQAPTEYVYTQKDVTLDVDSSAIDSKVLAEKTYKDRAGNVIGVVKTNKLALNLHKNISNKRPEVPAIEKYVNKNVHSEVALDEVFTYDVVAYVTNDADKVTLYDTLNADLQFVSKAADVTVVDLGTTVDHKPNGSVAQNGTPVTATATIKGQKLTATIADATALRGHWVKMTFKAKYRDGITLGDLKYTKITDNGPVLTNEQHEGTPNTASYKIDTENGGSYELESNTVTVKPKESVKHEVIFSKYELGDDTKELPGAEIKVYDSEGNVVDEWTSTTEAHVLKLEAGEYTFEEVNAPAGFDKITTTVTFVVGEDGTVTLKGAYEDINGAVSVKDINHLILEDMPSKHEVVISKYEIAKSEELEGAEIKIYDSEGNVVDEWTSTTEAHKVQLKAGEYELEEVNAPEGFWAITTKVRFTVDNKGKVTVLNAEEVTNGQVSVVDTNHLILEDMPDLTRSGMSIEVAKVNEKGEPLAGAQLKVTGVNHRGEPVDLGEQAVWTTDGTNHRLARVVPGKYTLTETAAPAGYKIAAPIEFEITLEGSVLVNGKLVPTPVITMTDELDKPNKGSDVEPTNPAPSPSSTAPSGTPAPVNQPIKSLVRTGAPAAVALMAAFALVGAGALLLRRKENQ